MLWRPLAALGVALLATSLALTAPAATAPPGATSVPPVVYRVSHLDGNAHTVQVECSPPFSGEITFALPRWVPGYYFRLPLRQYLAGVQLRGRAGRELPLREDPAHWTWRATIPVGEAVTLTYTLHSEEDSGNRGLSQMWIGPQTGFLLPAACFVYVAGHEAQPCDLQLSLPEGWRAFAPLPGDHGSFHARDFDQLDDSPVEMGVQAPGALAVGVTQAAKHPLRVITSGPAAASMATLEEVTRRAIEAHAALFGAVPFPDYTIEMHAGTGVTDGIVGLEHARAATLAFWEAYPLTDQNLRGRGASLVFHETFHAWNVKTMRPAEFSPYHLDQIPHCPTLWFAEGFTDYYADLEPVRCGYWTRPELFYEELANDWSSYADSPGRHRTSLMRASAMTFDNRRYGEGDGTNYYVKGMLAACLLDLDLRSHTHGTKSLDDVMRWVYREYPASRGGYPDNFLPAAIIASTGVDLSRECHSYLETTDDLPLAGHLALAGLKLIQDDNGTRITEDSAASADAVRLRRTWLRGRGSETADGRRWTPIFRTD